VVGVIRTRAAGNAERERSHANRMEIGPHPELRHSLHQRQPDNGIQPLII
jgi:hypothetical protein